MCQYKFIHNHVKKVANSSNEMTISPNEFTLKFMISFILDRTTIFIMDLPHRKVMRDEPLGFIHKKEDNGSLVTLSYL